MANWLLKASEKWLQSVYDLLHEQLCKEPVLHADETTLQVLKEPGRSSTSKSYMWLYRTSGCTKQAIVLILIIVICRLPYQPGGSIPLHSLQSPGHFRM